MDDRQMLRLSILYRLVRWLLDLSAVLMRRDLSKDTELLVEITYLCRAKTRCGPVARSLSGWVRRLVDIR
jgi:hypothetical protein